MSLPDTIHIISPLPNCILLSTCSRAQLLVYHEDDNPLVIKTTSTSSPRHLDVLPRRDKPKKVTFVHHNLLSKLLQKPEVLAIKLLGGGEENRPGGHVQAHGKGLGGEKGFQQTLAKKDLNCLLQDG